MNTSTNRAVLAMTKLSIDLLGPSLPPPWNLSIRDPDPQSSTTLALCAGDLDDRNPNPTSFSPQASTRESLATQMDGSSAVEALQPTGRHETSPSTKCFRLSMRWSLSPGALLRTKATSGLFPTRMTPFIPSIPHPVAIAPIIKNLDTMPLTFTTQ